MRWRIYALTRRVAGNYKVLALISVDLLSLVGPRQRLALFSSQFCADRTLQVDWEYYLSHATLVDIYAHDSRPEVRGYSSKLAQ